MSIRSLLRNTLLAALVMLCVAQVFAQSREADYLRRDFGKYSFVYCPEDSSTIEPLWNALRIRIPAVEQQIQLSLRDSVRFVITPSEREWARVTAGSPLWANGIAYSSRGVAVLKSDRFGLKYGGVLEVTALHEYVHLLLESGAPDAQLPRWLNEGLAQLLANQYDYQDVTLLGRAVTSGRLHRLWQIEGMMGMDTQNARLAYAQSMIAVEYLRDEYGLSGISNLVHELRGGKYVEDVFPVLFHITIGQFESELVQSMQATYGGTLAFDTDLWVSIAFVVLVFAAGLALYLRRRRTLARWKDEARPRPDNETIAPNVPYTVNYTLITTRRPDEPPSNNDDDDDYDKPHDKPLPGN